MRHLQRLRSEFDESFAHPARAPDGASIGLLEVTVAGQAFLIRVSEVSAVYADKAISALPGAAPDLLGVAGFRGSVVAIFDLGLLLGLHGASSHRWVIQARNEHIGFALESFIGHAQVPAGTLHATREPGATDTGQEVAQIRGVSHPLIELSSVVDRVKRRVSAVREA